MTERKVILYMINVTVSSELFQLIPGFKIGKIQYDHIEIGDSPQMLRGRFQLFQESLKLEFDKQNPSDDPTIKEWRAIVKKCGTDPSRYRHSAEALLRRLKKGNSIQSVNSAVDLTNFFSLEYRVPFGIYDLSKVSEPVTLQIGTENESYEALNGRIFNFKNKLVLSDQKSAFGSPFVDSKRTMITKETKQALQIVYLQPSISNVEAEKLLSAVANMFHQIHGGEANIQLVDH